jgi:hypothetical protein
MIRIQSNRKTKIQPSTLANTTPRIKASTQSILKKRTEEEENNLTIFSFLKVLILSIKIFQVLMMIP